MLEKPDLPDQAILSVLEDHYDLQVQELTFLPIGDDASSYVYKVAMPTGPGFFLKVKPGPVYEPAVQVPCFLRDQGFSAVVAPLPSRSGRLFTRVGPFSLILYPFIEGQTGMDQGLTPSQWLEFGELLARIHATQPPPGLAGVLQREDFLPVWAGEAQPYAAIDRLAQAASAGKWESPIQRELAAFWTQKEAEIARVVARCAQLAAALRAHSLELVLCHTDIHTANILLDPQGGLHIIDWDHPKLAPREHDLFFIGGSLAGEPQPGPDEINFLQGYGRHPIDPLAMTFYHYVWAVQEIGDYASRVFDSLRMGEETRANSLREFKQIFDPSNVIDFARRVDRVLLGAQV